jgi:hypothetical protein
LPRVPDFNAGCKTLENKGIPSAVPAVDRNPARIRPNPAAVLAGHRESTLSSPPNSSRGNNRDELRSTVRAFLAELRENLGKDQTVIGRLKEDQ